nr:alcohol dehydrogenase catalytic domain-containing protein [Saccharothrix sp. ST-888]
MPADRGEPCEHRGQDPRAHDLRTPNLASSGQSRRSADASSSPDRVRCPTHRAGDARSRGRRWRGGGPSPGGLRPPYAEEVFSGRRNHPLEPPVVPGTGGVGRIVSVGPDATRLRVGNLVWCDCTVRSRDDALTPDIALVNRPNEAGQPDGVSG